MITGDECGSNFLTFVLRLRGNPGKNLNQEIYPIGNRTRVRSGGFLVLLTVYISSVFCPRAGPSLQTQAPRLQFCSKAGLPLQTQEPRLLFY